MARTAHLLSILAAVTLLSACGSDEPASEASDQSPMPDASRYTLELDMHTFMMRVLEPMADELWESAGWINDIEEGYYELYPTTDEGWAEVGNAAAMVVEAGNALSLPSRAYDDDAWLTYSQAMSDVGLQAMAAAEAQNEEDLFQAGAQLYSVCTACHQAYNPGLSRFVDGEPER